MATPDAFSVADAMPYQKAKSYQFLSDNADKLNLTPDEEYKFNWGQDALSSDWIAKKAKEIQDQIEASNSTAILRRGLGKQETVEKVDDPAAGASTSSGPLSTAVAGSTGGGGGNYDGSSPGREAGMGLGTTNEVSIGFDTKSALNGAPFGLLGMGLAGLLGGSSSTPGIDAASQANEAARLDAKAQSIRNDLAESEAAQQSAAAESAAQAGLDHAAAQAAADSYGQGFGSGFGSSFGGNSTDSAGTGNGNGGGSNDRGTGSERD